MSTDPATPEVREVPAVLDALGEWQRDRAPMQLHPGDVGFHWRDGPDRTAAALRVWWRDGRPVAVGLLDAPQLVRMAVDPAAQDDAELVARLCTDLDDPGRGVLDAGPAVVEARCGPLLSARLEARGWREDEAWTPLHLDLADPVPDCGRRVEVVAASDAGVWVDLHLAAFRGTAVGPEDRRRARERWEAMTSGPAYADARCLTALDEAGTPVAVAGVWSAGRGRPGLLEPVGVHPDHRGSGHGRAVTLAAAAALRELGASSAVVCTPSANPGAVETYAAAGFTRFPAARDLKRD